MLEKNESDTSNLIGEKPHILCVDLIPVMKDHRSQAFAIYFAALYFLK